jgi:hypothetical protein
MRSCSNFFEDWHLDACNHFCQLTGDLFFLSLVSSFHVTHLLATCVLIDSLAKLSLICCTRSVLVFLQMVDAIIGKVTSSMVILLAFKVHCDTELFHGFAPRMSPCSGL